MNDCRRNRCVPSHVVFLALLVAVLFPAIASAAGSAGVWKDLFAPGTFTGYGFYDPVRERMIAVNPGSSGNESWTLSTSGAPVWADLDAEPMPAQTSGASVIYDPVRDRLLMFGGGTYGSGPFSDQTWELSLANPNGWTLLTPGTSARPHARAYSSAVYDATHDRLVVFGGYASLNTGQGLDDWLEDTWALSLSGSIEWQQVSATFPTGWGRDRAGVAYDPVRDRLIVHGGYGPEANDDVWALALGGSASWSLVAEGGPGYRTLHRLVYDDATDQVLMFGGQPDGQGYRNDVWALPLAGGGWTELIASGGPSPRNRSAVAIDPESHRLLVYGGYGPGAITHRDAWSLSLDGTPAWTELGQPVPRRGAIAVHDAGHDRMIVFGGYTESALGDVWDYSLAGDYWTQVIPAGTGPSAREQHAAVYDAIRDRTLVFGGFGPTYQNDLWALKHTAGGLEWEAIDAGPGPSARASHTMVYDAPRDRVILFGGLGPTGRKNDVWELTLAGTPAWNQLAPSGTLPATRYEHSAIFDPDNDRMIVFAGFGAFTLSDVWSLDLSGAPSWSPLSFGSSHPLPRYRHSAIHDPVEHRMIVFGNAEGPSSFRGELWELSTYGSPEWSEFDPSGFSAYDHAAIYDPGNDRMLSFGTFGLSALVWNRDLTGVPPGTGVDFALHGALPNPSRGAAWVSFTLPDRAAARLELIDVTGRRLLTREVGDLGPGRHRIDLGASRLAPGVYWTRLTRAGVSLSRRAVILR